MLAQIHYLRVQSQVHFFTRIHAQKSPQKNKLNNQKVKKNFPPSRTVKIRKKKKEKKMMTFYALTLASRVANISAVFARD